jgi:GT2 family glycosyltransferase
VKVSIIILNWNGGTKDCHEALISAKSQSYSNKEIIFVDNDSSDGSFEAVQALHEDVIYVQTGSNLGCPGGRNFGAEKATGELLFFLENDGVWDSDGWVEAAVEMFKRYPRMGAIYSKVKGYEVDATDQPINHFAYDNNQSVLEAELILASSFRGGASAIRSSLFKGLGGFQADFFRQYEEFFLSYQIYDKGYFITYCPKFSLRHKGSDYPGKSLQVDRYNVLNDLRMYLRLFPIGVLLWLFPFRILFGARRLIKNRDFQGLGFVISRLFSAESERVPCARIKYNTVKLVDSIIYGHRPTYDIKLLNDQELFSIASDERIFSNRVSKLVFDK